MNFLIQKQKRRRLLQSKRLPIFGTVLQIREASWTAAAPLPLLELRSTSWVDFAILHAVSKTVLPWPHAPRHQLSESGTYFLTASTYRKAHHFRDVERLRVLHRGLLIVMQKYGWSLEAWAVFSNHYHFVAHSPAGAPDASDLSKMLSILHVRTAEWANKLDRTPGRRVWFNYRETRITYEKSYLARLNYVHQNAVKHRLVSVANQYPWCSARWFERAASPAMVTSIYRFKIDRLDVPDDFQPTSDW